MNIIEFKNNVPVTDKVLNGIYEVQKKQKRNGKFLKKYWSLMNFFAFNSPEWLYIETGDDAHGFMKSQLGEKVYRPDGSFSHIKEFSISFAKYTEEEFKEFYSRVLDVCCKELGLSPETVINELVGYM